MEFKISNFNIMSDKHFDFFTWDEVKEEDVASRDKRYDQVINVIKEINGKESIDVMTFQEVTENSIKKLEEYAKKYYELYVNENKSKDKPILLATMIKKELVNATYNNIVDLTGAYQNFYNKNNYHSGKDEYFSGRAQVFYIKTKNLIVVNVHAPGIPHGFTQKLWYNSISAFIRCGCPINQKKSLYCYPDNKDVRIILTGDFNVSIGNKPDWKNNNLIDWTNEGNRKPELILFEDNKNRNTSYHSGIKDEKAEKDLKWQPDPEPYQKVDHLMINNELNNLGDIELYVYVSNNFDREEDQFLIKNNISELERIIPYKRFPEFKIKEDGKIDRGKIISWVTNYDINNNGWPSDHTFNLYVFPVIPDIESLIQEDLPQSAMFILEGGSNKEIRRYKIVY